MYTIDDIKKAQEKARSLKLHGWGLFYNIAPEVLVKSCNGIGADWMPELMRMLLNARYKHMQIPAMIHDTEFDYADGSESTFHLANKHFRSNGMIMSKVFYKWYNPFRYLAMWDAYRLYKVLELSSWPAYKAAVQSRRSK